MKITAYKTSDGIIFENEKDSLVHEDNITIKKKLQQFLDDNGFSGMDTNEIFSMIFDNKKELLEILSSGSSK